MLIKSLILNGYRNFKDTRINFTEKSLIIGSNDIGKSNLLHALRLLLDKTLSDADIEPKETDFYAHEATNEFTIRIELEAITEECLIAKLREHISDEGCLLLQYLANRDPESNHLTYKLFIGKDEESLVEIDNRFYLRTLSLKFIGSRRDLMAFIRQEKKRLLQDAKDKRNDEQIERDTNILGEIETDLTEIGGKVTELNYIQTATEGINTQLNDLSYHHKNQRVIFDVGASDPSSFVDGLHLASNIQGNSVVIGGDGRNNQIHLALWSARNKMQRDANQEPLEVFVFCIEEPEAHLHPHQQRKLAEYLSQTLDGQVIITTHSPQIACQVPPTSIIRLYPHELSTLAAGNGINPFVEDAFIDFGYRLNIISAEAFFADVVLLVEGPSEELFYKALANHIDVDLDQLNISVLMVDGVGFKPYVSLLCSLRIPFVLITDNDIFKIPRQDAYRFAGVQRALDIYGTFFEPSEEAANLLEEEALLLGFDKDAIPEESIKFADQVIGFLENYGVFIAGVDLEHDLYQQIPEATAGYFGLGEEDDVIAEMQKRKATFMFDFIRNNQEELNKLKGTPISEPLECCKRIAETVYGTPANL